VIDEKRLIEEIGPMLRMVVHLKSTPMPSAEELAELIRLARMGLWAEEHGVRKLKFARDLIDEEWGEIRGYRDFLEEALATLPKDSHG
jgi:hypothetical protein